MSTFFSGKVNVDCDGHLSDDKYYRGSLGDFDEIYFYSIAHAINSHDELGEINKELLAALEVAKLALEGSYDVNEWPGDGSSTCDKAIEVAYIAIAKAKGGEA